MKAIFTFSKLIVKVSPVAIQVDRWCGAMENAAKRAPTLASLQCNRILENWGAEAEVVNLWHIGASSMF